MSEGDHVSSGDNLDFPLGDPPQIPENTHHHRKTLLGIFFWREDRGNQGWAEYMGERGGCPRKGIVQVTAVVLPFGPTI